MGVPVRRLPSLAGRESTSRLLFYLQITANLNHAVIFFASAFNKRVDWNESLQSVSERKGMSIRSNTAKAISTQMFPTKNSFGITPTAPTKSSGAKSDITLYHRNLIFTQHRLLVVPAVGARRGIPRPPIGQVGR